MRVLFAVLFFLPLNLLSQNWDAKRDYFWRSGLGIQTVQATTWNFNQKPTKVDWAFKKHGNHGEMGIICNTDGSLLLFSNGCYFSDKNEVVIPNSTKMNQGFIHDTYCPPQDDGYLTAPMCILPHPKDTNRFVAFHTRVQPGVFHNEADALLATQLTKDSMDHFTISYIDSLLLKDTLERGHLAVCRHGNGRDWWIMHPKKQSNKYHKILFSAHSFEKKVQSIGVASTEYENTAGQAVFSPDGTKYVRYNLQSDIRIFDFDRCTGLLSNPIQISLVDAADTIGFAGCAISANARFLYIISTNSIYQFDLQSATIANSKTTILTFDNYQEPSGFNIRFGCGLLGADGKIYITSNLARWFLHTIEAPDSLGLACRPIQRKYRLINSIYDQLPVFPNYRLGTWKQSPCDTLKNTKAGDYDLKLYPNPAMGHLTMDLTLPNYASINTEIEVFDMAGRRVYGTKLSPFTSIHEVNISAFANGIYLICLKENGMPIITKKLTILH